jgi:hypothetical protein
MADGGDIFALKIGVLRRLEHRTTLLRYRLVRLKQPIRRASRDRGSKRVRIIRVD